MKEYEVHVLEVEENEWDGKKSWTLHLAREDPRGLWKVWSFPPGREIADYLKAHLTEPIKVLASEKEKDGKNGKFTQFSVQGLPGVIELAQREGGGGGGGRGQWRESWAQSEEGERFQQERSDRRTALMQAVTYADVRARAGLPTNDDMRVIADDFYGWLRSTATVSGKAADTLAFGEGTSGSKASPDGAGVSADTSAPPSSEAASGESGQEGGASDPTLTAPATASDALVPFGAFKDQSFSAWAAADPERLARVLRSKNPLTPEQVEAAQKALAEVGVSV
jgi:hypothetical protein